jgi:hypothetical protein
MGALIRTRSYGPRGLRSGYRPIRDRGGAPAFAGIVDALIAAGATVNFAFSCGYQIDTAGGDYALVRRASDNATAPIPIDTSTRLLSAAALATHCGANDGFIVTLYDRSGNARDVTNATTSEQPKIYDSATGVVLTGSLPMAMLDGGATGGTGEGDGWLRGDSAGYSGAQSLAVFYFGSFTDVTTYARQAVQIGSGSTTTFSFRHVLSQNIGASNQPIFGVGGYRSFTPTTALATPSDFIVARPADVAIANATLRQRGTQLVQANVVAGNSTIGTTALAIGSGSAQATGVTGRFSACIGLNAEPTAPQLALLDAFGATLCTTAEV